LSRHTVLPAATTLKAPLHLAHIKQSATYAGGKPRLKAITAGNMRCMPTSHCAGHACSRLSAAPKPRTPAHITQQQPQPPVKVAAVGHVHTPEDHTAKPEFVIQLLSQTSPAHACTFHTNACSHTLCGLRQAHKMGTGAGSLLTSRHTTHNDIGAESLHVQGVANIGVCSNLQPINHTPAPLHCMAQASSCFTNGYPLCAQATCGQPAW
jgi:hypothetical protein